MNGSSLIRRNTKDEFRYVKNLTKHYSKSFYLSTQLLPEERKLATYALYGFCRYADNIIDMPRNRTKKELTVEIDNLGKELQIAYKTGESEHPVIKPFIVTARRYEVPIEYPLDLLKGVKMDLYVKRYETFEDLLLFCYRVASTVGLMMTHVLGYKHEEAFSYAKGLGTAMQLTNILRDIKEDAELGRVYMPKEEMKAFGVTESDILNERCSENLVKFMKYKVEQAHTYFESAQPGIPMLKRESQYAIYAASKIYRGILHKIEDAGFNPFPARVYVSKNQKLAILLREYVANKFREQPQFRHSYAARNI